MYNNKEFTEEMIENNVGFVYIITNVTNSKHYIGKKLFTKAKTYQKNKKKKRTRVQSDWLSYTGSNAELNEDVELGHRITKTILHLCESKGECSYLELKEQILHDALLKDEYYNTWIQCKIRKGHLKRKTND